jgi:hypothetical protein
MQSGPSTRARWRDRGQCCRRSSCCAGGTMAGAGRTPRDVHEALHSDAEADALPTLAAVTDGGVRPSRWGRFPQSEHTATPKRVARSARQCTAGVDLRLPRYRPARPVTDEPRCSKLPRAAACPTSSIDAPGWWARGRSSTTRRHIDSPTRSATAWRCTRGHWLGRTRDPQQGAKSTAVVKRQQSQADGEVKRRSQFVQRHPETRRCWSRDSSKLW